MGLQGMGYHGVPVQCMGYRGVPVHEVMWVGYQLLLTWLVKSFTRCIHRNVMIHYTFHLEALTHYTHWTMIHYAA